MKHLVLLLVVALSALGVSVASQARVDATTGVNLAPDAGFESSPTASYYSYGTAAFSWATDAAHSGTHSLKIVSTQPPGTLTRWMSRTTAIGASPGTVYTASVYLKTASAGAARLSADFWNGPSEYLGVTADSQTLTGTKSWTQVSLTVTAPARTTFVRLEFRLYGSGTLWADDVSLTATGGPSGAPVLSGSPRQGQFLTTTLGSPEPSSPYVSWFRCDSAGANCLAAAVMTTSSYGGDELVARHGTTYLLTGDDVGHTIRSQISGLVGGSPVSARSEPTAVITATSGLPQNTAPPQVTGPTPVKVLTGSNGSWSGSPTSYAYQWFACVPDIAECDAIDGATRSTLQLDLDHGTGNFELAVIATNAAGSTRATTAERFFFRADLAVYALPSVQGRTAVGSTLDLSPPTWTGTADPTYTPDYVSWVWLRCDRSGEQCTQVAAGGPGSSGYTLTSADVGSTIRVLVIAPVEAAVGTTPLTLTVATPPTAVVTSG